MPEIKRYKQYEILQRPDGTHWELGSGAMGTTYQFGACGRLEDH
jgi:hypothetical protein